MRGNVREKVNDAVYSKCAFYIFKMSMIQQTKSNIAYLVLHIFTFIHVDHADFFCAIVYGCQ